MVPLTDFRITGDTWIGLSKSDDKCSTSDLSCRREGWVWDDGTPYTFQDWITSEPNDGELCMRLRTDGWLGGHINNDLKYQYLCEKGV